MLTRVLSMLPSPRLDETMLARVEAVLPQCSLNNLNTHALATAKWLRHDPTYLHSTPSRYVRCVGTGGVCVAVASRYRGVQEVDLT